MPNEPRLVRVVAIIEENFGTLIQVTASCLTDEGGLYPIEFEYGAAADAVHINRANAYDALFARVHNRASWVDVELAKKASREAAKPHVDPPPHLETAFHPEAMTTQEREAALSRRQAMPIIADDPERVQRFADARIDPDPDVTPKK